AGTRTAALRAAAADEVARRRTVPPADGPLTSRFGPRWGRLHAGIDFGLAEGSPVRAVAAGTIVEAGSDGDGYGTYVHVRHADGTVTTYSHLSAVERGEGNVLPGDVLGRSGSTGRSTGPHRHFEVRIGGRAVDPLPWLCARGVEL
ncbi:MAG: M23 family metallopeptidase, partial [Actinomycetota bacterium]|nr:M23 family metallopeptidase [Actinomycetota bacterium]